MSPSQRSNVRRYPRTYAINIDAISSIAALKKSVVYLMRCSDNTEAAIVFEFGSMMLMMLSIQTILFEIVRHVKVSRRMTFLM